MEFRQNLQELKSQIDYLGSLKKEDVTHIIKSSIYEIENLKIFNEEELNEINKVTLTSEPFNNLFFKYNKERLVSKGVVYLEEENDLHFIISLFISLNKGCQFCFILIQSYNYSLSTSYSNFLKKMVSLKKF